MWIDPEGDDLFACDDCRVVHAGRAVNDRGTHTFDPPDRCGACGGTQFTERAELDWR